jgi:hypothetical protein
LLALAEKDLWIYFNRLVDFHEIWQGGDAIEGALDALI